MMDDDLRLQRYIRILIGVCVLIVAVILILSLIHLFLEGTLTVKSDNSNATITITPVQNGQVNRAAYKSAKHQLSEGVSAGSYEISASYKTSTVSKIISIKSRQSLSFTLNPVAGVAAVSPEPVFGNTVEGVVAASSKIMFIDDANKNTLTSIDSNNNVNSLYGSPLYDAVWANTSMGLARDYNNNLYAIISGQVTKISLPFTSQNGESLWYSITPDGKIYVANGNDIYFGSILGNFHKIHSFNSVFGLSAGQNEVAAIHSTGPYSQDPSGNLVVVSSTGQVKNTNVDVTKVAFSPDGKYIGVVNDTGAAIYESGSLKQVVSLPSTSTNTIGWGKNDNFFYNQGNSLWVYGVQSGQSSILEQTPAHANILGIYPTPDGSYVYLSTASTNAFASTGQAQLFRVGLNNQPAPSSLQGLSVFLPESLNGQTGYCKLNYVIFTSYVITIHYPGQPNPTSQADCLSVAQNEIQQYGLSPGDFTYSFYPDSSE